MHVDIDMDRAEIAVLSVAPKPNKTHIDHNFDTIIARGMDEGAETKGQGVMTLREGALKGEPARASWRRTTCSNPRGNERMGISHVLISSSCGIVAGFLLALRILRPQGDGNPPLEVIAAACSPMSSWRRRHSSNAALEHDQEAQAQTRSQNEKKQEQVGWKRDGDGRLRRGDVSMGVGREERTQSHVINEAADEHDSGSVLRKFEH
jgi:hypothetical protein